MDNSNIFNSIVQLNEQYKKELEKLNKQSEIDAYNGISNIALEIKIAEIKKLSKNLEVIINNNKA